MSLFIALKHNKSRSGVTLPQFHRLLVHHHLNTTEQEAVELPLYDMLIIESKHPGQDAG